MVRFDIVKMTRQLYSIILHRQEISSDKKESYVGFTEEKCVTFDSALLQREGNITLSIIYKPKTILL